jgi:hypothetical protein
MTAPMLSCENLCVVASKEVVQLADELKGVGGNDITVSRPLKIQINNLEHGELKLWLGNGFTASVIPLDVSTGRAVVPSFLASLASLFLPPQTKQSFKVGVASFFVTKGKEKIVDGLSKSRLSSGFKEAKVVRVFNAEDLRQLVINLTTRVSTPESPYSAMFASLCVYNEALSSLGALYTIIACEDGLASTERLIREVINLHSRGVPGEYTLQTSHLNTINQVAAPLLAGNVKLVHLLDPCHSSGLKGCKEVKGLGVVKSICTRLHVSEAQLQWFDDRMVFEQATLQNSSGENSANCLNTVSGVVDGVIHGSLHDRVQNQPKNGAITSLRDRLQTLLSLKTQNVVEANVGSPNRIVETQNESKRVQDVFRSSNLMGWKFPGNGNFETKPEIVESPQNSDEAMSIEQRDKTQEEAVLEYSDVATSYGEPTALPRTPLAEEMVNDPDNCPDSPAVLVTTAESRAQSESMGRFWEVQTQPQPCAAYGDGPPSSCSQTTGTDFTECGNQQQLMVEELIKGRKINEILLREIEEMATKANQIQNVAEQGNQNQRFQMPSGYEQPLSVETVMEEKLSLEVSLAALQQELAIMRARCRALQQGSRLSRAFELCEQRIQAYQTENDALRRECTKLSLELVQAQLEATVENAKSTASCTYQAQGTTTDDVVVGLNAKLRDVLSRLQRAYTEIADQRSTIENNARELRQAEVARKLAEESFKQTAILRGTAHNATAVAETHSLSAAEGWATAEVYAKDLEETKTALEKERSKREAAEDMVKALQTQLSLANSVFLTEDFANEYLNDARDLLALIPPLKLESISMK